eukprot:gene10931-19766_t
MLYGVREHGYHRVSTLFRCQINLCISAEDVDSRVLRLCTIYYSIEAGDGRVAGVTGKKLTGLNMTAGRRDHRAEPHHIGISQRESDGSCKEPYAENDELYNMVATTDRSVAGLAEYESRVIVKYVRVDVGKWSQRARARGGFHA